MALVPPALISWPSCRPAALVAPVPASHASRDRTGPRRAMRQRIPGRAHVRLAGPALRARDPAQGAAGSSCGRCRRCGPGPAGRGAACRARPRAWRRRRSRRVTTRILEPWVVLPLALSRRVLLRGIARLVAAARAAGPRRAGLAQAAGFGAGSAVAVVALLTPLQIPWAVACFLGAHAAARIADGVRRAAAGAGTADRALPLGAAATRAARPWAGGAGAAGRGGLAHAGPRAARRHAAAFRRALGLAPAAPVRGRAGTSRPARA